MRFNDMLFYEKQKFTQPWIWIILLGANAIFVYGVITQVVLGQPFGDHPASNSVLIIILLFLIALTSVMVMTKLETVIEKDGLQVRFFPYQTSFRRYSWDTIQKAYTRKYNPIGEYGGWGLRGFGKNRAMNVSGNEGLQLVLADDKKLLIGTRKAKEIESVFRKIGRLGNLHPG